MNNGTKSSIYSKLLICITSFLILSIGILSIQRINSFSTYLMSSYIILLGLIFVYFMTSPDIRVSGPSFMAMTVFAIIILRLIWIIKIDTVPISDFEMYNIRAQQISEQIPYDMLSIKFGSQGFGYFLSLGLIYKVFGYSLIIGKLFNIVLSVFTAILLYLITKKLFSDANARIAIVLFAFMPSQIMYTSVIASEHIYVLFVLLGLYILIYGPFKDSYKNEYYSGIIVGFSYLIRQTSLIITVACIIYIFFRREQDRFRKILKFTIGTILILIMFNTILLLDKDPDPTISFENSLMMGTNYESMGQWNEMDSKVWSGNYTSKVAKNIALQIALERIVNNPAKFAFLVYKKYDIMWSNEQYGIYWSTIKLDTPNSFIEQYKNNLYDGSQFYYVIILVLALLGSFKLWKKQNDDINIFLIIFILFVFAHSFLEVQSRYHYLFMPIFLILASYGIMVNKMVKSNVNIIDKKE